MYFRDIRKQVDDASALFGECEPSNAAIAEILPPISRFKAGLLAETKMRAAEKLMDFFVRYYD